MSSEAGSDRESSALRRLGEWLNGPTLPSTGSTLLRVAPDPAGSWLVREPGRDKALGRYATREQAIALSTSTLAEARGGEIEVTEQDGTTDRLPVSKGKRPWWQTTGTPRTAALLGLLWIGLLTIRVFDDGWPVHGVFDLLMLIVSGILGVFYLLSAVLLRHRRRGR